MEFDLGEKNTFYYKNNSLEELVYVYNDMTLKKFFSKHDLIIISERNNLVDLDTFKNFIDNNYINDFRLTIVEHNYDINLISYFKSAYKFYYDSVRVNKKKKEISLNNQPYFELIMSGLNDLVIESLQEQVKLSETRYKPTVNKSISKKTVENYFKVSSSYTFDRQNLLYAFKKHKLIDNLTKISSIENIFKKDNAGMIDWQASKGKLGLFVKLLKEKGIIENTSHFEVAKNIFKHNGEQINRLRDPKKEDAEKIYNEIERFIDNNFTLKQKK